MMIQADDVKEILVYTASEAAPDVDMDGCKAIAAHLDSEEIGVSDLREYDNIVLVRELYRFWKYITPERCSCGQTYGCIECAAPHITKKQGDVQQ